MKTSLPPSFSLESIYMLNCHVGMMLGIKCMFALVSIDVGNVEVYKAIIN